MQVLGCNLKNDRMILVCFQSKPFNITVIQIYALTTDAKEAEVGRFYKDLQDLLELTHTHTHTQRYPFHHKGLQCKSKKSRDTWSNRQIWPWCTKWCRAREFCQQNTLVIANTLFQQHKRWLYTWTNGQYRYQIDHVLCNWKWRSSKLFCCHQKQHWKLTVAQIISSLLQNSGLNWRK